MKLFVAKTSQNKWLSSFSDEVKNLREGLTTVSIKSLMHEDNEIFGEFGVEDVLTGMPIPKNKAIHVLVASPENDLVEKLQILVSRKSFVLFSKGSCLSTSVYGRTGIAYTS